MKTIDLDSTSHEVADLLQQARADDAVIVRLADGSEFLLIALDEFDQEVVKMRKNANLARLLDVRAAQTVTTSLGDVKRRLGL